MELFEGVRKIMTSLPETEEYRSYGTPAFRVKKRLIARLKEDGVTLAVHADDRDEWTSKDAEVFFVTDHYRNYPMVLVNLEKVKEGDLEKLLREAWQQVAPNWLIQSYLNTKSN